MIAWPSTLMKMDPLVLKKVDPPVGPVWRAPTVSGVDLLVANKGRVIVPCQDRSRRRRWPKASLYKGLSLGHARPPEGDVGVRPTRGRPTTIHLNGRGWWVRKMSTPRVNSRERQGRPCPLGRCRALAPSRLIRRAG